MLEAISWSEYAKTIAVGVAGWYGLLAVTYYRSEITGLLKGGTRSQSDGPVTMPTAPTYWTPSAEQVVPQAPAISGNDRADHDSESEASRDAGTGDLPSGTASTTSVLQEFLEELLQILKRAGNHADRVLLYTELKHLLEQYPELRQEPEATTVENILRRESRNICGVYWQDAELENLWREEQ